MPPAGVATALSADKRAAALGNDERAAALAALAAREHQVLVIGGGVVACESATWLHGLGVEELTIIEPGSALLARNEPFAGALVQAGFEQRGVRVITGTPVDSVSRADVAGTGYGRIHGGPVTVAAGGEALVADELVVAAGRTPASTDLGLSSAGLADGGYVEVDDHLTVAGTDWLYVVGDLNGRALLTHMGKYQGRITGAVIAARACGTALIGREYLDVADHGAVPQVTFTDPQVASAGLTAQQARASGAEVDTVECDLGTLAGTSLLRDDYRGRAKLVIDRASDTLLGATFVGAEVGELIHAATVAIIGRVTLAELWHAVPSYPTASEVWLRLLERRRG